MSSRFEVVRSDAGFHSRQRAGNGQIVWTTESYTRRSAALNAIASLAREFSPTRQVWVYSTWIGGTRGEYQPSIRWGSDGHSLYGTAHRLDVRYLDERTAR